MNEETLNEVIGTAMPLIEEAVKEAAGDIKSGRIENQYGSLKESTDSELDVLKNQVKALTKQLYDHHNFLLTLKQALHDHGIGEDATGPLPNV